MKVVFLSSHKDAQVARGFLLTRTSGSHTCYIPLDDKIPDDYDLGISFLYNKRVPAEHVKNHTWINFHPAPLPGYGGRNVAYHAIMNAERFFGATVHYMDENFDTGDIIAVNYFPIEESDTAGSISVKARYECFNLFRIYVPIFLAGDHPTGIKQENARYYKKEPIDDRIVLTTRQEREVRAITAAPHFAKTIIGGKEYVLVPSGMYHPDNG